MYLDYSRILQLIFPLSEDEKLLRNIPMDTLQNKVRSSVHATPHILLQYSDAQVRAAIHLSKFNGSKKAQMLLATAVAHHLHSITTASVLIPIPLSPTRERARGYNQVTQVLKQAIANDSIHRLDKNILQRIRNTEPQTSLKREERLENLAGAFSVTHSATHKDHSSLHFVLIDDVLTTGSTLKEAEAILKSLSPASITCMAFAH